VLATDRGGGEPGWQPYCDRGHWAYTDSGWCWVSDYSWGWAPFHYGRWFRPQPLGLVLGAGHRLGAWLVSWRYANSYCGWACVASHRVLSSGIRLHVFRSSVGFNFGFGLRADRFLFVPIDRCNDRFPSHFRVPHREVTKIYNTTVVNNTIIRGHNNTLINRGVPVDRVAAATHTEIKPNPHSRERGSSGFDATGT